MLSFVELSKSSSLIPRLSPNMTQATQAAESWAGPGKRLPVQYITVCSRISLYIHSRHILAYPQYISVYLSISQYISIYPSIPQKTLCQYILVYTPQYFLSILPLSHSLSLSHLSPPPHTCTVLVGCPDNSVRYEIVHALSANWSGGTGRLREVDKVVPGGADHLHPQ